MSLLLLSAADSDKVSLNNTRRLICTSTHQATSTPVTIAETPCFAPHCLIEDAIPIGRQVLPLSFLIATMHVGFQLCAEDRALKALVVVIKQHGLFHRQQDVCSLLQVCHSLRTAIQQCSGIATVHLENRYSDVALWYQKFGRFVDWLTRHSELASSITINAFHDPGTTAYPKLTGEQRQFTATLLALGLQSASVRCPATLCLSTDIISRQLVSSLPVAALTALHQLGECKHCHRLSSAIGCLTNLRQLTLSSCDDSYSHHSCLTDSSLQPLSSLLQLTQLQIGYIGDGCDLQCLPTQLQQLTVTYSEYTDDYQPLYKLMSHLTCLEQLAVKHWQSDAADVAGIVRVAPELPQLKHVRVIDPISTEVFLFIAVVWRYLPDLQSLDFSVGGDIELEQDLYYDLMRGLATLTMLTKLHVSVVVDCDNSCVLSYLTSMVGLRELVIGAEQACPPLSVSGACAVASLTALTHLDIYTFNITDAMLTLLAVKLTGLRSLAVMHTDIEDVSTRITEGPMPAIGQLSSLTSLTVKPLSTDIALQSLQYLTGLRKLNSLRGFESAGQDKLRSFWANLGVTDLRYETVNRERMIVGRAV